MKEQNCIFKRRYILNDTQANVNTSFKLVLITAILFVINSCDNSRTQPNIILVLTDDQGWTDSSVRMMKDREDSRSDFYETPNMERMAKEGWFSRVHMLQLRFAHRLVTAYYTERLLLS